VNTKGIFIHVTDFVQSISGGATGATNWNIDIYWGEDVFANSFEQATYWNLDVSRIDACFGGVVRSFLSSTVF
jgi:hypothetical protein